MISRIDNARPGTCTVTWEVSNRCNYKCWYCPDQLHSGTHGWADLGKSLDFFSNLAERHENVFVTIIGGEPTLWPKLVAFLQGLPHNVHTEITTNASRTISWWKRTMPYLDRVVLAFHPNTANPDHFLEVANLLRKDIELYTMLLFDPAKQDVLYELADDLKKIDVTYQFKPIYPDFGPTMLDYDVEQTDRILHDRHVSGIKIRETVKPGNDILVDGNSMTIRHLLMNGMNRFKGFNCLAGSKRLHIAFDGAIYAGSCRAKKLGTIDSPEFLEDPVICPKNTCQCFDDVKTPKWRA